MFHPEIAEMFKSPADGRRFSEMEAMDILNYDSNEFMSSEFFDTIRSVDLEEDLFKSNLDDFNALSDTSSHIEGSISPSRIEASESERSISTDYTDESVSPGRVVDVIDDSLFELIAPNNFEIQATPVVINQSKPSKIIIQHPNNPKKVVHKQIINQPQIKKFSKNKVLKVQSFTANGKSVLVPYGVQTIKVINTSDLKGERIHVALPNTACRRKVEPMRDRDEAPRMSVREPNEVKLTQEERRLLDKEGIHIPAYHPLTKLEDRELKRIRRKIRNKISAQDSRKRKKEYVDNLEEKVRQGSEDNKNLVQRIKELQRKNKTLVAHINKLQSLLFNSSSSKATPSTCLMIVMLSVLLVSLPNINLTKNTTELSVEQEQVPTSRSLLSTVSKEEDALNMDEFFVFNKEDKFDENDADNENSTENDFFKNVEDIEKKYDSLRFESASDGNYFNTLVKNVQNLFSNNNNKNNDLGGYINNDYDGFHNKRGFIEPDIDDYESSSNSEPPAKKMKLIDDFYRQNDENFVPFAEKVVSATVQATNTLGESKDK